MFINCGFIDPKIPPAWSFYNIVTACIGIFSQSLILVLYADVSARQRLGIINSKLTKLEQNMTIVECKLGSAAGLP